MSHIESPCDATTSLTFLGGSPLEQTALLTGLIALSCLALQLQLLETNGALHVVCAQSPAAASHTDVKAVVSQLLQ